MGTSLFFKLLCTGACEEFMITSIVTHIRMQMCGADERNALVCGLLSSVQHAEIRR